MPSIVVVAWKIATATPVETATVVEVVVMEGVEVAVKATSPEATLIVEALA